MKFLQKKRCLVHALITRGSEPQSEQMRTTEGVAICSDLPSPKAMAQSDHTVHGIRPGELMCRDELDGLGKILCRRRLGEAGKETPSLCVRIRSDINE